MENRPVLKDLADMIKFSEKLRKENNGNLTEAIFIHESDRTKILYKMILNESGFELAFEEDLTPKKRFKSVKNNETGKMELDIF